MATAVDDIELRPVAVLQPDADGGLRWPTGVRAAVGTDGRTIIGPDGRVLQGPRGQPLVMNSDGYVLFEGGQDFKVAVYPSGKAVVLAKIGADLYQDLNGCLYTPGGERIVTSDHGAPLSSKDGRMVIAAEDRLTLTDGTLVARGPDGMAAQWADGSVVIAGADNQTILGPDNRVYLKNNQTVSVNAEGFLLDPIGCYVLNPYEKSTGQGGAASAFLDGREMSMASVGDVHTRSVQLKEALNNANVELRSVKDALEACQGELAREKARASDVPRLEELVGSLQQELREASSEDAMALQRLQVAVETQRRRMEAQEAELVGLRARVQAAESTRDTVNSEYKLASQRSQDIETSLNHDLSARLKQIDDLSRQVRSLEEAKLLLEQAKKEEEYARDTELMHLRHALEVEAGRRERAEETLAELRKEQASTTEDSFNQITNISIDRDRLARQIREKERQLDEAKWEAEAAWKESRRTLQDVEARDQKSIHLLEEKTRLESDLQREKEGRLKDLRAYKERMAELNDEKTKALRMIPNSIAESERAKAVAVERADAAERHNQELVAQHDELREEVAMLRGEVSSARRSASDVVKSTESEVQRLLSVEKEYRTDRAALEEELHAKTRDLATRDEELSVARAQVEKLVKKKEKKERKMSGLIMEAEAKLAAAQSTQLSEEAAAKQIEQLTRERDEAQKQASAAEARAKRAASMQDTRGSLVDALRGQVTKLQEENQLLLAERDRAASQRLTAATTRYQPVSSPPPAVSPQSLFHSMPYQATATTILAAAAETGVGGLSRYVSPTRLDGIGEVDSKRLVRGAGLVSPPLTATTRTPPRSMLSDRRATPV